MNVPTIEKGLSGVRRRRLAVSHTSREYGIEDVRKIVQIRKLRATALHTKVEALFKRKLHDLRFSALMLDGAEYKGEHLVTALGIDSTGRKMTAGFHQGASETQQVSDALLADLATRGRDFSQPHLNIIDGGTGLCAALREYCGDAGLVRRCRLHKRSNVWGHFAGQDQPRWDRKLANTYDLRDYKEAKTALLRIQRELMEVNPSAARSLQEGLEETLTVCRNVKRWRPGNQLKRWVRSGLIVSEKQFRRIDGYRTLPGLISALEGQSGRSGARTRVA
jgi:putative transposase